ncbi:flavin reductase family protein [Marinovum algicola]|uniref:flavin reductase family protein n=1 Tax=Marinovum algicola TaxID=42444 RepID=UPI00065B0EA2|nr:flavin reductase family protein [Marinovum algicola]AKP00115.1 Conserved protein/domain protein typically associated with flavoprotein oxygenase, DIM6/NTAB family [Marinovum algicola DG 898]
MSLQEKMTHFVPGARLGEAESRSLRGALSRFGTGVAIVTTQGADGPVGMTVNSFSSVSLDPPLVLWSAARASRRYPHFAKASHMAIHVLGADQLELCQAFAASAHAFDAADWHMGADDLPVLKGCLARFDCAAYAEYDGGDHGILVARVLRATIGEGAPLLCYQSRFGRFDPEGR